MHRVEQRLRPALGNAGLGEGLKFGKFSGFPIFKYIVCFVCLVIFC
nr:MAG TPA: hypothetical protein [Caudoviricetes sp.]